MASVEIGRRGSSRRRSKKLQVANDGDDDDVPRATTSAKEQTNLRDSLSLVASKHGQSSRKTPVEIQIQSVEIETVVKPAEGTPSNFVRDKKRRSKRSRVTPTPNAESDDDVPRERLSANRQVNLKSSLSRAASLHGPSQRKEAATKVGPALVQAGFGAGTTIPTVEVELNEVSAGRNAVASEKTSESDNAGLARETKRRSSRRSKIASSADDDDEDVPRLPKKLLNSANMKGALRSASSLR